MPDIGTFEATCEALAEVCRGYGRPRVLDVGCGRGEHLIRLAPVIAAGLGIDVSAEAAAEAARRSRGLGHLAFRALAVERLPEVAAEPFDVVTFVGSLEHMADPVRALAAARACTAPAGRIVVVAIAPRAPHAVASRLMLRRSAMPVVGHLGLEGLRRCAAPAGLAVEAARPLARGRRGSPAAPWLALYDRIGGPTQAVVLRPDGNVPAR